MSEASSPAGSPLNRTWQGIVALFALVFNASVILYVILAGEPANSLHVSALAWAWGSGLAILAGLGIGSSLEVILPFFRK